MQDFQLTSLFHLSPLKPASVFPAEADYLPLSTTCERVTVDSVPTRVHVPKRLKVRNTVCLRVDHRGKRLTDQPME